MNQMDLSKKLIVILLWGLFSYFVSQLLVDAENTQKGLLVLLLCAGLWMTEIVPLQSQRYWFRLFLILWEYCLQKKQWLPFQVQLYFYLWVDSL